MSADINLFDMGFAEMEAWCATWGEPRFRATQVLRWIHQLGVIDINAMTNLSKSFRHLLAEKTCLTLPDIASEQLSEDGTQKWLLRLADGNHIETVFIPEASRGTLCISSQVGCALNCRFCATATQGFNRNLTVGEIIGQVWLARDRLKSQRISNIVLMGMGEPMLNFDAVVTAMDLMMNDLAYGLSKYRVTLSTSGVLPRIYDLAQRSACSLAISLHAPNDDLRNILVPINKKYPLASLMQACKAYFPPDSSRRILFEYVMLKDINDTPLHARQLIRLLQGVPAKVNLIPFNPFPMAQYTCSTKDTMETFANMIRKAGLVVTLRRTRGEDIAAACGQLVGDFQDKTVRSAKYRARYTAETAA